jgi:anti-anti-sigma factor
MTIQNSSNNAVLVDLPPEPQMRDKIQAVTESLRKKTHSDVVMDFSSVDIIATPSISGLLQLRQLLADSGHQLRLRNLAAATKGIFTITGLDAIFELVDNKCVA